MDEPIIERGNTPIPRIRSTRHPLITALEEKLPQLSPGENLFFPIADKEERTTAYRAFRSYATWHKLPLTIRFVDGGLRVWKAAA
jgi:hypothetical protein